MMAGGFVYGEWLMVRKALPSTKKGSDTTWHLAEAILDFVLMYGLENLRKKALTKEKVSQLRNIIYYWWEAYVCYNELSVKKPSQLNLNPS